MKMMEKEANQVANMTFADPILRIYELLVRSYHQAGYLCVVALIPH